MKMRLQANSLRLRLRQTEVARLMETGAIEESIRFLPGSELLTYRLQLSEKATITSASLKGSEVIVEIPAATARHWSGSSTEVGIEAVQPAGAEGTDGLAIIVEKDFACLDGSDADNADTFPNPLAGSKC